MSAKPRRVASVRALEAPLTDTQGAAVYLGCSPSFVLQLRAEDAQRVRRSEQPEGPRWHTVGARVVYLRRDLDEWLEKHLVPFGKTARGRKPAAVSEDTP